MTVDAPIQTRPLWQRMAEAIEGQPFYLSRNDRISAYLRAGILLGRITVPDFIEADALAVENEKERRAKNT